MTDFMVLGLSGSNFSSMSASVAILEKFPNFVLDEGTSSSGRKSSQRGVFRAEGTKRWGVG